MPTRRGSTRWSPGSSRAATSAVFAWRPMCPKRAALAVVALAVLAGSRPAGAQAPSFNVDFSWEGTASCFDPKSPPFSLSGVPAGTKRLSFAMKDLDAPGYPHGGGIVAYAGQPEV